MRTLSSVLLMILVMSAATLPSYAVADSGERIEFTYCYETRELFPHFLGEGFAIPQSNPGAVIEVLKQLDDLTEQVDIQADQKAVEAMYE